MLVTNQTAQDYWFGPLHLLGGVGQTLTVDDTSATSLYLTEDAVADAINNLYLSGKITVSSAAAPFPRPTGVPQLLHGDGAPEGLVFAPQGSVYMRRDGTGANSLYTKTTGVTLNTGWENYTTTAVGPGTTYRKTTAKAVNTTVAATDLLNGEITIGAGVTGTTGVLRATLWGDFLQNAGGIQTGPRLQLIVGGTTIFDTGISGNWTAGATRASWRVMIEMVQQGAANAQDWSIDGYIWGGALPNTAAGNAFTTGTGYYGPLGAATIIGHSFKGNNTGTIDFSVAKTFVFNVINGANNASYETRLQGALVEII